METQLSRQYTRSLCRGQGKARLARLSEHLSRVSVKGEVAIISFGWVGVIKAALQRMFLMQRLGRADGGQGQQSKLHQENEEGAQSEHAAGTLAVRNRKIAAETRCCVYVFR